jgi:hypothetical protein
VTLAKVLPGIVKHARKLDQLATVQPLFDPDLTDHGLVGPEGLTVKGREVRVHLQQLLVLLGGSTATWEDLPGLLNTPLRHLDTMIRLRADGGKTPDALLVARLAKEGGLNLRGVAVLNHLESLAQTLAVYVC